MQTPLQLNDEELRQLLELAEPVAYGQRRAFLAAVASELAACPQPGQGAKSRIARDVQRRFVLQAPRIAPGNMRQGLGQAAKKAAARKAAAKPASPAKKRA